MIGIALALGLATWTGAPLRQHRNNRGHRGQPLWERRGRAWL